VKRAIAWFAGNHVAANLLMCVLLFGGLLVLPGLPQKTFPDIDIDWVIVSVPYPGAAPEEVEQGVCIRIEEEIYGIAAIESLHSQANENACVLEAELISGADVNATLAEVKNRIDGITTFPDETEKPIVSKMALKRTVMDVAISGNASARTLKALGQQVRDEIAALPGITQSQLNYTAPYEISIEVPEEALRRYGIRFGQVVDAVRRSSVDLPGGSIKTRGGEILLRSVGQARRSLDFEDIVLLTRADGTRVTLGEVARVVDGFEETHVEAEFDGDPAVMVRVSRVGDQDVIELSDAVRRYVAEAQRRMPDGIQLTIWKDASKTLRGRLDTLLRNGRSGLVLVLIVLALFLRFRLAFWVSLGVPVAFLGALMMLPLLGITINSLSLFAFIVVLGIVVDDAIVVGENVHTHERRTGDRQRAAVEGTQEVAIPVIFGVLTTVAAFAPLLFVPGPMGQIFSVIGTVVIACLVYSVIESQLVLPAHLSRGNPQRSEHDAGTFVRRWRRFQGFFSDGLERFAHRIYRTFLKHTMEWRYLSLAVGIGLLVLALGMVTTGRMSFSFFPPVQRDFITVGLTMPHGTPVEVTRRAAEQIGSAVGKLRAELDPEHAPPGRSLIKHVLTSIGTQPTVNSHGGRSALPSVSGSHIAEVVVELLPSEERSIDTGDVAQRWRELVGPIPEAEELIFSSDQFSAGDAISIRLQGPDIEHLQQAATRVQAALAQIPGVYDIADSFRAGKSELKLTILPEAEALGISQGDLARQVRQAFYGEEAQRLQRDREDIRVMVRYPAEERRSLGDLEDMRIRTADGVEVPFTAVARAELGYGYTNIWRVDRMRVVSVTADVDEEITTGGSALGLLRERSLPGILADYPGMSFSLQGEQREQNKAFGGLLRGLFGALVVIYALLAVPLRSYFQPLIIMSVIPFGIMGAVAGHLLEQITTLSFMSVIGMAALAGVVVNSSLVLVDFINRRRAEGVPFREAVEMAGVARFRPIVLTSLTTYVGLTPLMRETSLQAQFLIPMAVSLAYGVIFATFVTLLLVPCGYLILEDIASLFRRGPPETSARRTAPSMVSAPGKAA
jgi:multidrug efflux pump subunit AcrB